MSTSKFDLDSIAPSGDYADLVKEYKTIKEAYEKRLCEDRIFADFDDFLRANYNSPLDVFSAQVLQKIAEFTEAYQGVFYVVDRKREQISVTATYAFDSDELKNRAYSFSEGIIGEVVRSAKTKYFRGLPAGHTLLTTGSIPVSASEILIMPLVFSEIVFGVLELFFAQPLDSEKYTLLDKLNQHISATLESILNVLGTKELLSESTKQAEALVEARKINEQTIHKYEQILEGSSDPIIITDQQQRILFFNKSAEDLWNVQSEELLNEHINVLFHDGVDFDALIGQTVEIEVIKNDKQYIPVLWTMNCIELSSGPLYTSFVKDITLQKEREQEIHNNNRRLVASEEELRQNIEEMELIQLSMKKTQDQLICQKSLTDALLKGDNRDIYVIDTKYKLLLCNDSGREAYAKIGVNIELGMDVLSVTPKEEVDNFKKDLDKVLEHGESFEVEFERDFGNRKRHYMIYYFPIRDTTHQIIGVAISIRDITKKRKQALLMNQMSFVFSTIQESVWILKNNEIINCNQASVKLFGCSDIHHMIGKTVMDFSSKTQTRKDMEVDSETQIPLMIETCIDKGTHVFEWRHLSLDGRTFDCEIRLSKLEFHGEILLSAVHRDITESKHNEKKLANQNKRITDSIRYAESIQKAVLPKENSLNNFFDESFVLYFPKDIVSGDFYWFASVKGKIFLTVADCTGHGVPGAFMSMIGILMLNQIILEKRIFSPDKILVNMDVNITKALRQQEKANIDGIDLALVVMEKVGKFIQIGFCGSKRPLYYVSKGELGEIKGSRKSIGGVQNGKHFKSESLKLPMGSMLYLTSDGYVDQNNSQMNKLGSRKLRSLLQEYATLPAHEQKEALIDYFLKHKGKQEQRDDVTLLGVKL